MRLFIEYLEHNMPKRYRYEINGDEIIILNKKEYVYLFYRQEIEEDFDQCCSLLHTVLELTNENSDYASRCV